MYGHPNVGLRQQHLRHRTRRHPCCATDVLSAQSANEEVAQARSGDYVLDRKLVSTRQSLFVTVPCSRPLSGCITTIIRLRTLLIFKISVDPTWEYVPIVIWTELEITAAFACVSLPAIRVLLEKITPKSLKGWLNEVTHGSGHQTLRQIKPGEGSSKRDWHKDDTWINSASTEVAEGRKEKIGFLPSAETSTSHLKTMETRSTTALSEGKSPTIKEDAVMDKSLPRTPVSVRSKFSSEV